MKLDKLLQKDSELLKHLNEHLKCPFLDMLMPLITYLGSIPFCIAVIIFTFYKFGVKSNSPTFILLASLCLSTLISNIIKLTVNRVRPFLTIEDLNIKKIGIDDYSFPSGHTTVAFSIAVFFSFFFRNLLIVFLFLASLVGLSRVYLGVHYPTDVIIGFFIGSICSIIMYLIFKYIWFNNINILLYVTLNYSLITI